MSNKHEHAEDREPDTKIFPIYLSDSEARRLVDRHLSGQFSEGARYLGRYAHYEFSAIIQSTEGDVEVVVTYSSDDGFILSAGCVLRDVIRPYSKEQAAQFVARRKLELAAKELDRRRAVEELAKIMAIHEELFP